MTARTPNDKLRDLIAESGLTYGALAKAVRAVAAECGACLRTNKSAVEHWISGTVPLGETSRYLAVALSRRLGRLLTPADLGLPTAPGADDDTIGLSLGHDPLDALLPMWRYELDRRHFLTTSAYSVAAAALPLTHVSEIAARTAAARTGHTVGMAEVSAVRDMISAFSELDERHGGQHGRSALVTYLRDDVAPLCRARFRTDEIRQQMLSAASCGVHLLGWKSYDAGQQGLAQRYYLQSYALAAESGIPGHDGWVMRTMAMQGLKLHRPEHCHGLAETGLSRARGESTPRAKRSSASSTPTPWPRPANAAPPSPNPNRPAPCWPLPPVTPSSSGHWPGARPQPRCIPAPPRSTRPWAITRPPPSTTPSPPPPGLLEPTPGSSPSTWSPARRCTSSAAALSRRASPGTGRSTTWTAFGPCAPARPSAA